MASLVTALDRLRFLSTTPMTTPEAGVKEYDGKVSYFTPNAGNRAVDSGFHLISLSSDYTLVDDTSVQPVFNSTAAGAITLPGSTAYLLEGVYHIHTTGTTSHQVRVGFGLSGGLSLTSIGYDVLHTNGSSEAAATTSSQWISAATVTTLTAAVATATHHNIVIKGIVRVNAGGTFTPQMQWTAAPGVAGVVLANSYLKLTPFGANTAVSVGNWS